MPVLLKITRVLKRFLRSIIHLYFLKNIFFSATYNDGKSSLEEENIIKDVRNLSIF